MSNKKERASIPYQAVQGGVGLVLEGTALAFSVLDGDVDETCVTGFVGCGQDQGWVGSRILRSSRYVMWGK